jgi:hypothetical protein
MLSATAHLNATRSNLQLNATNLRNKQLEKILGPVARNEPACTSVSFDSAKFLLTPVELQRLCDGLRENTYVQTLSLHAQKSHIGVPGAKVIASMLEVNSSLTAVEMSMCDLGDEGAMALATAILEHPQLKDLAIAWNDIGSVGARAIFGALAANVHLESLNVFFNPGVGEAIEGLAMLVSNTPTLATLSVAGCNMKGAPLQALVKAILANSCLKDLDLTGNNLGDEGAQLIADLLMQPQQLHTLKLSHNHFGVNGGAALAKAMKANNQVTLLDFGGNAGFNPKHCQSIAASVARNRRTQIGIANGTIVIPKLTLQASIKETDSETGSDDSSDSDSDDSGLDPITTREGSREGGVIGSGSVFSTPAARAPPPKLPPPVLFRAVECSAIAQHMVAMPSEAQLERELAELKTAAAISTAAMQAHAAATMHIAAQNPEAAAVLLATPAQLRRQELALLTRVHTCTPARDYYRHVRLLLLCAHTGAAAIAIGQLECGLDNTPSTAGQAAVDALPSLINKKLGKAAEVEPLLSRGALALRAILLVGSMVKEKRVHLKQMMSSIAQLGRTPEEVTAIIDALARKLTVLQWGQVTSKGALAEATSSDKFRAAAIEGLGREYAESMYSLPERRRNPWMNDSEKKALADVEIILAQVAEGTLTLDCPAKLQADASLRGEHLAMRCAGALLPGRSSADYDELLFQLSLPPPPAASVAAAASVTGGLRMPTLARSNSIVTSSSLSPEQATLLQRQLASAQTDLTRLVREQRRGGDPSRAGPSMPAVERRLAKLFQFFVGNSQPFSDGDVGEMDESLEEEDADEYAEDEEQKEKSKDKDQDASNGVDLPDVRPWHRNPNPLDRRSTLQLERRNSITLERRGSMTSPTRFPTLGSPTGANLPLIGPPPVPLPQSTAGARPVAYNLERRTSLPAGGLMPALERRTSLPAGSMPVISPKAR